MIILFKKNLTSGICVHKEEYTKSIYEACLIYVELRHIIDPQMKLFSSFQWLDFSSDSKIYHFGSYLFFPSGSIDFVKPYLDRKIGF